MKSEKKQVQNYEMVQISRKEIIINNFLGGVSWALGTSFGLTVVLALIGLVLKNIGLVPIIGSFVTQIADFVAQNSQTLR